MMEKIAVLSFLIQNANEGSHNIPEEKRVPNWKSEFFKCV